MTTQLPEKIEYCTKCELEYAARQCTPCPLCSLRIQWTEAEADFHRVEPWKVVSATTTSEIQKTINSLEANGWSLHEFHVAPSTDLSIWNSELIAVMVRRDYSPEKHAAAAQRETEVFAVYLEKKVEIEAATDEYRESRFRGEQ